MFRILTLNVNGIRSAGGKGLFRWLPKAGADVVCLQETKAHEADIPDAWRFPDELHGFFHCAQKKGYSGTALYSKKAPLRVATGFGVPEFDAEGRYVQGEFRNVTVVSAYFPSGSSGPHRQESKFRFLDVFFLPTILICSLNDLLFTVPANLISGHPYWYTAAMNGEFGPVVAAVWNFYVIGIYTIAHDLWCIVLGAIAIRRVQGIPWWTAALISPFAYVLWVYGITATFVR
jgi:hypothetical protein